MRKITVNTTVHNEVCEERRSLEFDNVRSASVFMDTDEVVWTSNDRFTSWSMGLGTLVIHDITEKQMLALVKSITTELDKPKGE